MFAETILTLSGAHVSSGFNFWRRKFELLSLRGEEKILPSCDHGSAPVRGHIPSAPRLPHPAEEITHSAPRSTIRPTRAHFIYLPPFLRRPNCQSAHSAVVQPSFPPGENRSPQPHLPEECRRHSFEDGFVDPALAPTGPSPPPDCPSLSSSSSSSFICLNYMLGVWREMG